MVIGWRLNPYRLDPIQITAQDRATDGYVVGIRLITNGENGHKVWTMRTVPSGQTSASWSMHLQATAAGCARTLLDGGEPEPLGWKGSAEPLPDVPLSSPLSGT
ncbi:hypothetical protein ACH4XT_00355 [Streptomyces avidinii]|uniref:hypothetical protein n=1 Tax=Streptomyces avidinii TaxID=1895 RepID=UPI00379CF2D3